jgi:lysophospholipase L1-like esterase
MEQNKIYPVLAEEDSSGIYHNVPNMRYGKWEINSLGFRGKEIDLEKKEGQMRIVCLGVSETFGVYEGKDQEWPSQLGQMLKDQFPRVEVVNASVIGLNLKKNKDYIEKYVYPLKPDIMILVQTFLIYTQELMRAEEKKHWVNNVKDKKVKIPTKVEPCTVTPDRVLPKLGETIKRYLPEWLFTTIRRWMLHERMRRKERKHLPNKEPMGEVPEHVILEFKRDLRSFVCYLKEKQIVPVLSTYPCLLTPFNKDIYKDILLATRVVFCIELSEEGILDAARKSNDAVRRIAKEENVVLVDNDYLFPKTLEYFIDNFHYTDKGAEFMAKKFYDILSHCKLIK